MNRAVKGRCLCGSISYSSNSEPVASVVCNCTDCQHHSGSAFSTLVAVPVAGFEVKGSTLSSYEVLGEDTQQPSHRYFCTRCGSSVFAKPEVWPDLAVVHAGTLDDPTWFKPDKEIWCRSAQPWLLIDEARPREQRNPQPVENAAAARAAARV